MKFKVDAKGMNMDNDLPEELRTIDFSADDATHPKRSGDFIPCGILTNEEITLVLTNFLISFSEKDTLELIEKGLRKEHFPNASFS